MLDPDSEKNVVSLYVYAAYWVFTVVTTVGYGHANYQTNIELLYCCLLEIIATLCEALAISLLAYSLKMDRYDFNYLLHHRLLQADEWVVFKIQA